IMNEWFSHPELRGVIISSEGRHFSIGADLEYIDKARHDPSILEDALNLGRDSFDSLLNCPVPTVAAIQRSCFGGGLEIALSCHVRVASDNSEFGFPESSHGFLPALGGTHLARLTVGQAKAKQLILSGEIIDAEEALNIGLIHYVVDKKILMDKAKSVLNEMIGKKSPYLIRKIVKSINNSLCLSMDDALKKEQEYFCKLLAKSLEMQVD
ncbi:MAG: enoyl-CoA hydratase/isomerase family protein, partial [Gammaproteobacteria bacterium]|nr:enoyl-CoA hydratase/isomerase family protein [Gammaproteobacteria bacterium]